MMSSVLRGPSPLVAASMCLCFLLVAAAGTAQTVSSGPIRSGCELDYPPFCIVHDDGTADGFSVELLTAALQKMGREVTYRTGPWSEVRGWLERGEIDALPLVGRTPEREELFDFTVPYLTMHGAIVVRRDTTDVHTLEDLRGRVVAVMEGDNAEEFLRREPRDFQIVTEPTFADAFRLLAAGGCDAVVIQRLVAIRLLEETDLTAELRIVDQPILGFEQNFCFAVTEGNHELLAVLNEGLALAMADGTHRRLYAKWFAHLELPTDRAIVIGGDANDPPFEFLDENGRPQGYNVDLVRAAAQAVGLTVEIRLGLWTDMLQALESGEVDGLEGMCYSPERDRIYDFSQAHIVNHCVAVVRAGEGSPPSSAEELKDKRIVVQAGDIMHDFVIENELGSHVTAVASQEEALLELSEGDHDCALVARSTALYWIDQYGWRDLVVGRTPLLSPEYGFAVPAGSKALLAELSEGLTALEHSGEYQRIYEKWMGVYDPNLATRRSLRYVGIAVGSLFLVVLLVLLWSWNLRKQVKARTAELRKSTEFQRAMVGCSPVALYAIDLDGTVLTWNESAERVFGWTAEEAVGSLLPIVPEDQQGEFDALRRQVLEQGGFTGKEVRRRRRDGDLIDVSLSAAPVLDARGRVIALMGAAEDITERKQHEARIEHLNRVLRAIRDVNQLITHENDRDALLQRSCEILTSTRGYRSAWVALRGEDGTAQTVAECGIGEDFAPLRQALERGEWPDCCRQAWASPDSIAPIHNPDRNCKSCGLSHTYRDTAALAGALHHGGREYGVLVVALRLGLADDPEERALFRELVGDVAYALHAMELAEERKEAMEALRKSEERFRVAQEMSPDGFTILHPVRNEKGEIVDFTWVYENQAIARINGTDPQEILGKRLLDLFPTHRGTSVFAAYLHVANTGKAQILEGVYVGEMLSRPTWLRLVVVSMGEDIAILAQDITERKRAEVRTEKLLSQQRAINRFALALGALLDLHSICRVLAEEVGRLQGTDTLILSQFDKDTNVITPLYVMMEGTEMDVTELPPLPLAPEGKGMQSQVLRTGKPVCVPDWAAQEAQMRTKYAVTDEKVVTSQMPDKSDRTSWTQSAVFVPLMLAGTPIGVMQVQSHRLDDFDEDDVAVLEGMASVAAAGIETARLHGQVRASFEGVVHALAASTEMRDPYTAGHQRRVTELACAIAAELGLDSERREVLRVAGLLHDIGKMSVPAEILSKPSGLSSVEMELLKGHARAGYEIVRGTSLPKEVADAVLHHHERMDGSGYPDGLSSEAILLEARILAVADVVEAMVSHRPYRAARTLEEALTEIETGAGTLYDADVADTCVRLFREEQFRFSDEPGGQDSM